MLIVKNISSRTSLLGTQSLSLTSCETIDKLFNLLYLFFLKISPGCSLEGLMLKLKLQYFGHLMQRADSFEKTLMLEKIEVRSRRGRQDEMAGWHHRFNGHGDCSHEIKRRLLLGRQVMTNLDSILTSRDITLSTKVCLVKVMVFPVVMYGCKSWTVKKAECRRIDVFELWCWRRLFRVPWTARPNQSILKEISPGCSLEGMMLRLKLLYSGHLM